MKITYLEIQQTAMKLNDHLEEFESYALNRARHLKSPWCWRSLKDCCHALGLPNSGRNRTLIVRAKRYLKNSGLIVFKRVFQFGERLADLFFTQEGKTIQFTPRTKPKPNTNSSNCGVAFEVSLVVLGCRKAVGSGAA